MQAMYLMQPMRSVYRAQQLYAVRPAQRGVDLPFVDLSDLGDLVNGILSAFLTLLTDPVHRLLLMVQSLTLRVPEVTYQQPVMDLTARSLQIVQVGYVVLAMIAVLMAMGHGSLSGTYSAKDVLQRMVLGFLAAHESTWFMRSFATLTNTLISAVAPGGADLLDHVNQGQALLSQVEKFPETILLVVLIEAAIALLTIWLILSWFIRFAALAVAAGLGPLALACHGLPWLEPIALAWWRDLSAVMLTVFAQAVTLRLAILLFLDPGPQHIGADAFDSQDVVVNLLLVLCLLLLVVRMPGVIRQGLGVYGSGGRGFGFVGAAVRIVAARYAVGAATAAAGRLTGRGGGAAPTSQAGPAGPTRRGGTTRVGLRSRSVLNAVRGARARAGAGVLRAGGRRARLVPGARTGQEQTAATGAGPGTGARGRVEESGRSTGAGETSGARGTRDAGSARAPSGRQRLVTPKAQRRQRKNQRREAGRDRRAIWHREQARRQIQRQRFIRRFGTPPTTTDPFTEWRQRSRAERAKPSRQRDPLMGARRASGWLEPGTAARAARDRDRPWWMAGPLRPQTSTGAAGKNRSAGRAGGQAGGQAGGGARGSGGRPARGQQPDGQRQPTSRNTPRSRRRKPRDGGGASGG